jgi:hypothetical protein
MMQHPKTEPEENTAAASRWPAALRRLIRKFSRRYHPERHYMRGGRTGGAAQRNAAKARATRH